MSSLDTLLGDLVAAIGQTLQRRTFLALTPSEGKIFLEGHRRFGKAVTDNLPSAIFDLDESSKCRALGRHTAGVFHLMRALEIGLRVLGTTLNDPGLDPMKNPSWERILGRCDNELKKPHNKRSVEWQQDSQFFSEATANLRAVKDAWRNPTVHVEKTYTEEEALGVYRATKTFLRHLATKLSE